MLSRRGSYRVASGHCNSHSQILFGCPDGGFRFTLARRLCGWAATPHYDFDLRNFYNGVMRLSYIRVCRLNG